jgi:hypothetical protein
MCELACSRFVFCPMLVAIVVAVAGCGGAVAGHGAAAPVGSARSSSVTPPADPVGSGAVAVRIEGSVISVGAFDRRLSSELSSESASERLVPPNFTACVVSHKPLPSAPVVGASTAALRRECRRQYQALRQSVLGRLISNVWVVGAARELGVDASASEVKRAPSTYRAGEARVHLDAEAIRAVIRKRVGPVTATRVAAYYKAHLGLFAVPQQRDLEIVRTGTLAAALAAKRELAAGQGISSVARAIVRAEPGLPQPYKSSDGVVLGLEPGVYAEPPLNEAIFKARPGVLLGPVRLVEGFPGFFVFEVKKIIPGRQKSLAEVAGSLKRELPEELYLQALASFIARWRSAWRARTDCSPGFVVLKCKQFGSSRAVTGGENPYLLN